MRRRGKRTHVQDRTRGSNNPLFVLRLKWGGEHIVREDVALCKATNSQHTRGLEVSCDACGGSAGDGTNPRFHCTYRTLYIVSRSCFGCRENIGKGRADFRAFQGEFRAFFDGEQYISIFARATALWGKGMPVHVSIVAFFHYKDVSTGTGQASFV